MYGVAIGVFDGIHLGHKKVLEQTTKYCIQNNLEPAVFTFYPSKKGLSFKKLTDRFNDFKKIGFNNFFIITPKSPVYSMNGKSFLEYLSKLGVKFISVGRDFSFGKNRTYDINYLREELPEYGISLNLVDIVDCNNSNDIKKEKLSTSSLKKLLEKQDFQTLREIYNEKFTLSGIIIKGRGFGTTKTGFKTANLKFKNQLLPPRGVYITEALLEGKKYTALTYIGNSPILKQDVDFTVETHILDKDFPPLYGKKIIIEFKTFLRKELSNIDKSDLIRQIKVDVSKVINADNRYHTS